MELFTPGETPQTLTIIPRFQSDTVSLTIRKDEDQVETTLSLPAIYSNGYLSMDFTYKFIEDESYTLEAKTTDGKLLWRGMAFATDQTPQEYKINADIIQI